MLFILNSFSLFLFFFFFNDTATTEIYTLSLHDALPIFEAERAGATPADAIYKGCLLRFRPIMMTTMAALLGTLPIALGDRKSTRLNSSHSQISYAVFCLKKKKENELIYSTTASS